MNRRIRRLGLAFAVLYLLLFVQLNRVQFFGAERLQEHSINSRGLIREFGQERGAIVSADGVVIARSVEIGEPVDYRREYPEGELYAHIAGYQSLNVEATGLERIYNDELAGVTVEQQFRSIMDLFSDRDTTATLHLTIRDDVQRAARDALGDRRGSVVVLDPRTGAVIAMWTWPSFDPNLLADPDGSVANAAYEAYLDDSSDPLLAKAYRELFFPGSTFKLVTAAAGVESGTIGAFAPEFPVSDAYDPIPAGAPIQNFAGSSCGGDLVEILRVSCNTAFAEMGAEWVGPEQMVETAELFGFNQTPPIDLPNAATSRFPTEYGVRLADVDFYSGADDVILANGAVDIYEDSARLAQTSIGQNDVAATPLQMAMIAAAIANDGQIMVPHVVHELTASDGTSYGTTEAQMWRQAIRPSSADVLRAAMVEVAVNGTARNMVVDGLLVGGKTGTAQLGTDPPNSHAWVVGFAGTGDGVLELAIAVIVEAQEGASEQTGGAVAAPIARAVIEAYFDEENG